MDEFEKIEIAKIRQPPNNVPFAWVDWLLETNDTDLSMMYIRVIYNNHDKN